MRRLILSGSVARRHGELHGSLRAAETGALLLAESRGAADDLVLAAGGSQGVFGVEKRTPYNLALEIAAPALGGAAPLTLLGAEAIAALVATRTRDAAQLGRLAEVARMPGFPRALARTLSDVRAAGLAPDDLAGAGEADLGLLLREFEAELAAWGLADEPRVFAAAAEQLLERPHRWASGQLVLLDLELRSKRQAEFLARLVEPCAGVEATLGRGDPESLGGLRRLLESGVGDAVEVLDLDAEEPEAASGLARAKRQLFQTEQPGSAAVPEGDTAPSAQSDVVLFSASAEGQECVEIARRIRDLANRGLRFDQVAVVVRDATGYLPLLEDALQRARIPAYFSRGTARPDPAGRAFLALLACATENLSATSFAEYLSLAQVPAVEDAPERPSPWVAPQQASLFGEAPAPAPEVEPVPEPSDDAEETRRPTVPAPARWERILVDAAVVGGIDRWSRRLRGRRAELELRLRQVQDRYVTRALQTELDHLGRLEAFALPLLTRLDALPERAPWGEWIDALEEIAGAALRDPDTVLRLLAELRPMREVGPVSLVQVQQILSERLSLLRRQPPKRRYGAVFVGLLEELSGRSFDAVFLPGLAEGVFPRRAFEDPLLPDARRAELSPALAAQDQRLARERLLLHRAVESAELELVVSYPRVDAARGRARVPSFYALDLLRAAEGDIPDLREISRRAASASTSAVGWAVPNECEDAIDDAEFDLALLRPLLQEGASAKGKGRFLLLSNPHLERSLRARARRWRRPFTGADGLVLSEGSSAFAVLEKHHPRARSFSPTALQHFAACPYRFFLQAVQRLRPRDEIVRLEELDPLTRGSIFHELQFDLLSRLRDLELLPVTGENLPEVHDALDAVFDAAIPRFAEDLAPAIRRVWLTEVDGIRNDLRGWLGQLAQTGGRWTPRHFELGFGLPLAEGRDPRSREDAVEVMAGIQLRGAIDLVEIDRRGERYRVTDHKTGLFRPRPRLVVGQGEVLQPVLYALVAEALLVGDEPTEDDRVSSGRLSYCTQRGGYESLEVDLNPESRKAAERVLDTVAEALETGFMPALPRRDACSWCDYQRICGPYEELRAGRKDLRRPLVRRLMEVRREP